MGVVANLLHGPARVLYAPVGTAIPADSVAYGAAWTGWTDVGFTKVPVSAKYDPSKIEFETEQALTPVKRVRDGEGLTIETALAEITSTNLALGLDGTVTNTAAGAGQVAVDRLEQGGEPVMAERSWGFEGFVLDATGVKRPFRMIVHKATSEMSGDLTVGKKEWPGIPLTVEALADTSKAAGKQLMDWRRVTAAATS